MLREKSHNAPSDGGAPLPRVALSVREFCASVGIGRTLFYEEVKAGRIQVLKARNRTLVPVAECHGYLQRLAKSGNRKAERESTRPDPG